MRVRVEKSYSMRREVSITFEEYADEITVKLELTKEEATKLAYKLLAEARG